MLRLAYKFEGGDEPDNGSRAFPPGSGETSLDNDDLPYKVEVWDAAGEFVEHLVAVSAHAAIGYAAYFAAAREFLGRDITLRFKGRVISRWTGRSH